LKTFNVDKFNVDSAETNYSCYNISNKMSGINSFRGFKCDIT